MRWDPRIGPLGHIRRRIFLKRKVCHVNIDERRLSSRLAAARDALAGLTTAALEHSLQEDAKSAVRELMWPNVREVERVS